MILYFTGTGNSEYVARALADRLDDDVLSLNAVLRGDLIPHFTSRKPYVVVTPIHAWRIPQVVSDLLPRLPFLGSDRIYFVATMAGDAGGAARGCRELAEKCGMHYMGFATVRMPDNCVYLDRMPSKAEARKIISRSTPDIALLAQLIASSREFPHHRETPATLLKSGNAMHAFYSRAIVSDRNYVVSSSCVGCSTCEGVCPIRNIHMVDGRPTFGGNCCACYACIQHCPREAIEIKGRSEGHGRYVCPTYQH